MIKGNVGVIVIDVQKDLLDTTVQWYKKEDEEVVYKTREFLDVCRESDMPIIYLQEIHRDSMIDFGRELDGDEAVHCLESSPRTPICAEALGRIPEKEPLVPKRRYSGFLYTDLEVVLSGMGLHPGDTLILTGGFTDVCVHYTFADAHQRDYRLRVVKDLCVSSTLQAHENAIEAMRYLQHEAPCTQEEVTAELREWAAANR